MHCLAGHAERARDDRLRRDHRRHGGEQHHRHLRPGWKEQEERVRHCLGRAQDQRALGQVVESEGGKHEQEPGAANRRASEVAHVRVQRLGARHG